MSAIVITGVSTGIGYATAKLFTSQGIIVFGSVRNEKDKMRLQNELGENYRPLLFDVTNEHDIQRAAHEVRTALQGQTLWGLINNAGCVVQGTLATMPIDDFKKQLDINLIGQLMVTQAFLPLLGTDKTLSGSPGKIINISSVSGKTAYPFFGAYAASKHGLEALSEALRRELMIFGIDVIIVGPGTIKTEIWDKARAEPYPKNIEQSIYKTAAYKFKEYMLTDVDTHALPKERVATLLLQIMQNKRPKVRYAPVPQKWMHWIISNILPKRFLDWAIAKKFGLLRSK